MSSIYDKLLSKDLLNTPPSFLKNNIHYEVMTGSVAYGCNDSDNSDIDVVGFAIPPKDMIFPHTAGYVPGFDTKIPMFNSYQQHHILDLDDNNEYDMTIYGIVQFFKLAMDNNPNMIDLLFVPRRCILFSTQIGEHVRDNRHKFLHKGSFYKFRGYAKSQLHKLKSKNINSFIELCDKFYVPYSVNVEDLSIYDISSDGIKKFKSLIAIIDKDGKRTKRIDMIAKYGYDVKFAYHLFRLFMECEQILVDHDLILDRDREVYKSVRRGGYSKEQIFEFFDNNEQRLQTIYDESNLRSYPDVKSIRQLLLDCLEMHYGSLDNCISRLDKYEVAIRDIKQLLADRKL
jgi:hypothetical protein